LTPDERDRMNSLCKQIVTEKDRDKFIKLVEELNNLLDRKRAAARRHAAMQA
jgi:hypothetical protein